MSVASADIERRMDGALATLKTDLGGLRIGRTRASMHEPNTVDDYGPQKPMSPVGTTHVPQPRTTTLQV